MNVQNKKKLTGYILIPSKACNDEKQVFKVVGIFNFRVWN